MLPFLVAAAVMAGGGSLCLGASVLRWRTLPDRLGPAAAVLAAALGVIPALGCLTGGETLTWIADPWLPGASLTLRIDALSAWFLLPILFVSALAAIYGAGYLKPSAHGDARPTGAVWSAYLFLMLGMVLTVTAGNALVFLLAWETMALASFFLVVHESDKDDVRRAGWIYLIATHLGTAFLLAFFAIRAAEVGSLDFALMASMSPGPVAGVLFVFAAVGFGVKAGFMPFHVWLPEAHPAAPSFVSAVMSGVMIKTGVYGLLRAITFLGTPPAWWGWLLIAVGLFSGVLGILLALAQSDLKRALAYSSVENIGIVALGIGLGLLGRATGSPILAAAGFGGALLHVLNHALMKSLLFLGAGAVLHATGTREVDRLGGLLKKMPRTGTLFLFGAAAISGLPPLNGFLGEFLLYYGSFTSVLSAPAGVAGPALAAVAGLALLGGVAAACFTKLGGAVFLGEARTDAGRGAHDPGLSMTLPMLILAGACAVAALGAPLWMRPVARVAATLTGDAAALAVPFDLLAAALRWVALGAGIFLAILLALVLLRRRLLAGREVGSTGTWDCGYAAPTARMQYTGSSFAQPLAELFAPWVKTIRALAPPVGLFPRRASVDTHAPDPFESNAYRPLFFGAAKWLERLRATQHGRLQLYILYVAVTLVALLLVCL